MNDQLQKVINFVFNMHQDKVVRSLSGIIFFNGSDEMVSYHGVSNANDGVIGEFVTVVGDRIDNTLDKVIVL